MDWLGGNSDTGAPEDIQSQRSDAWHKFRAKHIGASEVAILLGKSEWATVQDLWASKTGKVRKKQETSYAMQRGIDAEPRIRELYEKRYGTPLITKVVEFPDFPVISASLDGLTESGIVVEFKYPSRAKHEEAAMGKIPDCYVPQIQCQMMCVGAMQGHYVSFDGEKIAVVETLPDSEIQKEIVRRAKLFWELVVTKTPPDMNQFEDFNG